MITVADVATEEIRMIHLLPVPRIPPIPTMSRIAVAAAMSPGSSQDREACDTPVCGYSALPIGISPASWITGITAFGRDAPAEPEEGMPYLRKNSRVRG